MTVLRSVARFGAGFSTIAVRLASFIFLRWIPSHILWPMVIAFWALFILSFIVLLSTDPDLQDPVAQVETSQILQVVTNGATEKVVEVDTLVTRIPKGPPRRASWMETMYLGIPNPSALLSFATTGVNAVMVLMTLDLAFRRYLFHPEMDLWLHRPVPTSPHSCNIFVRAPPESPLPLQIYYKNVDAEVWNVGPTVREVDDEMDYTSVVSLEDLIPGTAYQYAVLSRHTDITAANDTSFGSFETFPQPGSHGRFSFGSSSCIFPGFPYNPTKHPLEIKGLEYLKSDIPNLKFFAFLGDFIYADVPHRHPPTPDNFFMQYRQAYASPSFPPILNHLPWYHVHDDHDIANDYDQGEYTSLYRNASRAFTSYHRAANPSPLHDDVNYFIVDYGDTSFFYLDTRRYRTSNFAVDGPGKSMLGARQLEDLVKWARHSEERGVLWKFIISSVPMTVNWKGPDGQRDTWGGFQYERQYILDALKDISNVVVISGDRHEAAVTALPNGVLEVSVSPLNQFYIPIRTYHTTETDQELAYFPDGNQKYAVYTVDTTDPTNPKLEVEIKIAGKTAWNHTFAGKSVVARSVEPVRGVIEKGVGWLKQILISSRF